MKGVTKGPRATDRATSLIVAAGEGEGHLEVVQHLIKQAADKDKAANNGFALLCFATGKCHLCLTVMCLLLQHY